MRTVFLLAGLQLLGVSFPAQAEEATGRVRGLYYEAPHGGLLERPVPGGGAVRWADVELERDARRVLVHAPAKLNATIGDRVAVQLVDPGLARLTALHRGDEPLDHASRIVEVHSRALGAGAAPR
jgi:hypothetical protein